MAQELPTPIPFEDFARRVRSLFDDVARKGQAILVERDGMVYRLELQLKAPLPRLADPTDIWRDYDPAKVKEAFHRGAGLLKGVATAELLRDVHEQREQDSTGRPAD